MYILFVPLTIVLLVVLGVVLLLTRCRKTAWTLLFVALLLNLATQTFPLNLPQKPAAKGPHDIDVITYNVHSGEDITSYSFLASSKADLLLIQEPKYLDPQKHRIFQNFPYYPAAEKNVFSRYPIRNFHRITLPASDPAWEELVDSVYNPGNVVQQAPSIFGMDIDFPQGTVHVVNCHLRSNQYSVARQEMAPQEPWIHGLENYYQRTAYGYKVRAVEARLIRHELDSVGNVPTLVIGDMNDFSGSPALRTLQNGQLHDAWWKGGLGPCITYDAFHLKLQLDHMLYSNHFTLKHIQVLHQLKRSDHYPLSARFTLP